MLFKIMGVEEKSTYKCTVVHNIKSKRKKKSFESANKQREPFVISTPSLSSLSFSHISIPFLSLSLLFLFQIRVFANSIQSNSLSQIPCLIQSPPLLPLLLSPETSARKRGYISQFRIHSVWFSRKLWQTKQNCDIFLFRFISFENLFYF